MNPIRYPAASTMRNPTDHLKYVAEISQVREVSLIGTADLEFWNHHLQAEGLFAANKAGQAQIVISAMNSKFKGIRFHEFCISIVVSEQPDGKTEDGLFLIQAFNSIRLFAFVERTFFSTPYAHGRIQVRTHIPATMEVCFGAETLFSARMGASSSELSRTPNRSSHEQWLGPIYLPKKSRGTSDPGKFFFAKIEGATDIYDVSPDDTVTITNSHNPPIFNSLRKSNFVPKEWHIRESANHAKAKTMKRKELTKGKI
jgi:hypothetical protein